MGECWPDGYSAQVDLYLLLDGRRHEVAQVGNRSFILRDATPILPGTTATLVISIDGREKREEVFLPEGAAGDDKAVPYF